MSSTFTFGNYSAQLREVKTKKEAESQAKQVLDKIDGNPLAKFYKFTPIYKEEDDTISKKYRVLKRRQVTKQGNQNPTNPCDDKGSPVTVDGKPLWGEWIEGTKQVTILHDSIPSKYCTSKLRSLYWKEDDLNIMKNKVEEDIRYHTRQQSKRKNPVQIEHKIEKVSDEVKQSKWVTKIKIEKIKEPKNWIPMKFSYKDHKERFMIPIKEGTKYMVNNPIKISLKGVGQFKGRKQFTEELEDGKVYSTRQLSKNLTDDEFVSLDPRFRESSAPSFSSDNRVKKYKQVPNTQDYCVVTYTPFSSYYRSGLKFSINYFNQEKLMGTSDKQPLSLAPLFTIPKFSMTHIVEKQNPNNESVKYNVEFEYLDKAPKSSVEYCDTAFKEISLNAMVSLEKEE
jgi:hypothetical protein